MKKELIGLIQRIPYGMVVSYGELAVQLDRRFGIHTSGWMVGRVLSNMSPAERKHDVVCPRWRVINKQGVISSLKLGQKGCDQIALLQSEGIQVLDGKVDMKVYEYSYLIPVPSACSKIHPVREGGPQRVFYSISTE